MDIINQLRHQLHYSEKTAMDVPAQGAELRPLGGTFRPQTVTELLDAQIDYHKNKIRDLEEAKAAITPEFEKALNALAKI